MSGTEQAGKIDFTVATNNLYREEAITDLKVASIRRLVPVNADGTEDKSRTPLFMGHTQMMSPEGPVPIQSKLEANNLEEAISLFPEAMEKAFADVVERLKEMQRQQQGQQQQRDDSRIIVPGR